jgi:hypothetical protein
MNKTYFKGEWFAYEAPEKPQAFGPSEEGVELMKQYKINLQQAKANALPVLNPEILNKLPIPAQNHLPDTTDKIFPQEGVEYDWPGTMKKQKFPFLDGGWKDGYILSLPETPASGDTAKQGEKDFENLKLRVGFTVAHLNDHSKTVAGALVRQDLKTAADLILELYDRLDKSKR